MGPTTFFGLDLQPFWGWTYNLFGGPTTFVFGDLQPVFRDLKPFWDENETNNTNNKDDADSTKSHDNRSGDTNDDCGGERIKASSSRAPSHRVAAAVPRRSREPRAEAGGAEPLFSQS